MSATHRYDIGRELSGWLFESSADLPVLVAFNGKNAERWAGVYKPRWKCFTFAVKLPAQVAEAYRLLRELHYTAQSGPTRSIEKQARTLGLPETGSAADGAQGGFFAAIHENPGDLANWSAYADWLMEQPGRAEVRRGETIAGWLGDKAVKKLTAYQRYLRKKEDGE